MRAVSGQMSLKRGLVACVSDSFDVFKACREYWGDALKEKIQGRISQLLNRVPVDRCVDI